MALDLYGTLPVLAVPSPPELPSILHDAPLPAASLDLAGHIFDANEALLSAGGYTLDELRGRSVFEFLEPDGAVDARAHFLALVSGQVPMYRAERRYRGRTGVAHDVQLTVSLVRDGGGAPAGCLALLDDVSEHKNALREVARKAAELEAVIESMPAAVYIIDKSGVRLANALGLQQLGFRDMKDMGAGIAQVGARLQIRDAATGQPIPVEERAPIRALRGERVEQELLLTHLGTGEQRRVRAFAAPVMMDGAIVGSVGISLDITEQHAVEEERERLLVEAQAAQAHLHATSRVKDEFLATLSHELRTPLNAVLGWAKILRTRPLGDQTEHAVTVIERNAIAQARLIDDLLDLSRIITGKTRLNLEEVDVGAIASEAFESLRPAAEGKGLTLALEVDEQLPRIRADGPRVQQILWNLLSNAIKFTEAGGRVSLSVGSDERNITAQVTDTGIGVPGEILPKVFDRFIQGDSSSTRAHSGLGLGLSIVRYLVELHGGTVTAASDGRGQGATFGFTLPRR